jgi:hypothetical protein
MVRNSSRWACQLIGRGRAVSAASEIAGAWRPFRMASVRSGARYARGSSRAASNRFLPARACWPGNLVIFSERETSSNSSVFRERTLPSS